MALEIRPRVLPLQAELLRLRSEVTAATWGADRTVAGRSRRLAKSTGYNASAQHTTTPNTIYFCSNFNGSEPFPITSFLIANPT